ncbi:MAG TPA: hypothetical protein VF077_13410 [Nitrospiraceae bacterium]
MKRIMIYRTPTCWMADFHGDAEVMAALGTDQVPTAFTASADRTRVLAEIQRLNSDANVTVDILSR